MITPLKPLSAALLIALTAACGGGGSSPTSNADNPPITGNPSTPQSRDFPVVEATLADIHAGFADGSLTCTSLVQKYLDRIDASGGAGILDFDDLPLPPFVDAVFPSLVVKSVSFRRALVGMVLGILAIMGDLVESSVKRASRQKDSCKLLPGHGGILDRFDSTLLSAAVYYNWCLCSGS